MPGLVEALGELYVAQPKDPYAWMAHWFATNDPPTAEIAEEWPSPCLRPQDALEEAASAESCHVRSILGAPMYDGTWNFRRCKDRDPVYGVGACDVDGARAVVNGLRKSGHREIAWVFLADEPLVYVGGEPVVVALNAADEREAVKKNASLESTLLTNAATATKNSFELERLEARLKSDVLASAAAAAEEAGGGVAGFVRVLGTRVTAARRTGLCPRGGRAQIGHAAARRDPGPARSPPPPRLRGVGKNRAAEHGRQAARAPRRASRQFERVVSHYSVDEDAALFACNDDVRAPWAWSRGAWCGAASRRARGVSGRPERNRGERPTRASKARPVTTPAVLPVTSMLERLAARLIRRRRRWTRP